MVAAVVPESSFVEGRRDSRPLSVLHWLDFTRSRAEAEAISQIANLDFFCRSCPFGEVEDPVKDYGFGEFHEFVSAVSSVVGDLAIMGGQDLPLDDVELADAEIFDPSESVLKILGCPELSVAEKLRQIDLLDELPPLYAVPPLAPQSFREWRIPDPEGHIEHIAALCDVFGLRAFVPVEIEIRGAP